MEKTKDKIMLKVLIYFAINVVFFFMPAIGQVTSEGMRLIGLFIAFIYGMTITNDPWPALFTLVLFPLTGLTNMNSVLLTGFGSDVFLFVLFSLALIQYMESSGASAFVATWLLKRKILIGHPWRLIAMLLFICWLITSFTNAVAGLMITWAFIYQIFAYLGYKPYEKTATLIMFGTCIVAALGLASLPWGNNSLVIFSAFTNVTGMEINYMQYMGFSIPYALMAIVIYIALCRFVFKADVSAIKSYDPTIFDEENLVLTAEKKAALSSVVILVLMILLPIVLPQDSFIVLLSKNYGLSGKLLFIFAILQIIRINGQRIFSFVELTKSSSNWKLMLLVADILVFSSLISTPEAGISAFLTTILSPIFVNKPAVVLIIMATFATVIMTNFMVNKIVAVLMISVTVPIAVALQIDLLQLCALYTVACTIAFMLPAASQASTVFFANSDWAKPKDVFIYGLVVLFVLTILVIAWNLVYFTIF